jgi:hypothetical protein
VSAKKKAATSEVPEALTGTAKGEKWVLGYTARGTQQGSWNVMFVPSAKLKDIEDMNPVPEAKLYKVAGTTETIAVATARQLLKAELAKVAGGAA